MKKQPGFFRRVYAAAKGDVVIKRQYSGASFGRLVADWFATAASADAEVRSDLVTLRNRCRSLERDNDYVRKYFSLLENNVLGHGGVALQLKIEEADGVIDEEASGLVERSFYKWARRENCTLSRKQSWNEIQRLALRSVARDGEVLVRLHRGATNSFRFAVTIQEADHLDHTYETQLAGGNVVRMGIEFTPLGEPVAYYLRSRHPGDSGPSNRGDRLERVPASDIIHLFRPDRPGQSRGTPWLVSAISRLRQLGEYEVAEVVAARVGASKMGFFKKMGGAEYEGEKDDNGQLISDASPGTFEQLPEGIDLVNWNPEHPSTAFGQFVKACLRGISSSLGVPYNDLANDLEGVNYSSIRAGLLEAREHYKSLQQWLIESLCEPVFSAWLEQALLTDSLPFPISEFESLNRPVFTGRRWPWVDPEKDINASALAIQNGFTSRRAVITENGGDIYEVLNDQAADDDLAKAKGLTFPRINPADKLAAESQQQKGQLAREPQGEPTE